MISWVLSATKTVAQRLICFEKGLSVVIAGRAQGRRWAQRYRAYPPNTSSAPSPLSRTLT